MTGQSGRQRQFAGLLLLLRRRAASIVPESRPCRPPTRTEMGSMNLEIGDIDMLVVCLAQDPADVLVALTSESIRLGAGVLTCQV